MDLPAGGTRSGPPLVRAPKPIRELRNLTRYRKAQIEERTREAQRLDKVLQDAGVKLSSVATNILGVSGRAMLTALVEGTRDPEVLAELARGRLRTKIPALKAPPTGFNPSGTRSPSNLWRPRSERGHFHHRHKALRLPRG